jgi:hypothetical protein
MYLSIRARSYLASFCFLVVVILLADLPMLSQVVQPAAKMAPSARPASKIAANPDLKAPSTRGCMVKSTNYLGWKAEQLSNKWVTLEVVPEIGGRLIQVTFGGHDLLYVNPALKGQSIPPGTRGGEHNYGGDKIWPLPEGNQDEQHWSGAGGHLDGGPFTLKVLSRTPTKCAVRLTGPINEEIGQRYIRDISIGADTPVISFHVVMQNMTGFPQTWSEQTITEFATSEPAGSENLNTKWWGVTELNPKSVYPKGYHVRTGPEDNPAFVGDDGKLRVHWNDIMQEVWVDSPSGWLAAVNGETGYTVVMRHKIDPFHQYPGDASIIFYSSGPPRRRHNQNQAEPSHREGPFVEAEMNSPSVELGPGESYAMDTTWYPTRMGEDFKTTTWAGVFGKPLTATRTNDGLALSGEFGVFYAGNLVAHLYPKNAEENTVKVMSVVPTEPVQLQTTIQAPPNTSRVSIHLVDAKGVDHGPLGEVLVNPPPSRPEREQ